jgi:hypothetical protein
MTRRKDDDGKLAVDLIRDTVWKDVNRLPEQILEDLEAKGFNATLSAVQSTRSGFIANLTWLAKKGIYISPILGGKLPPYLVRKKTIDRKAVEMAHNVTQQSA